MIGCMIDRMRREIRGYVRPLEFLSVFAACAATFWALTLRADDRVPTTAPAPERQWTAENHEALLKSDPEYARRLIDLMIGKVLFYENGVLIGVEQTKEGSLQRAVLWAGDGRVHAAYMPAKRAFSYSSGTPRSDQTVWIDLNTDGWWDIRVDEKLQKQEAAAGRKYINEIRTGRDEWMIRRTDVQVGDLNGFETDNGIYIFDESIGLFVKMPDAQAEPSP